ncbi:hypothetical protein [Variovorax sp. N23]|uniref:hypothetical protein n=1 Tax=Variovorax sp. N23 TaxID=2980555 RepID=UPI0021CAD13A|nr:hypothetical protein [Variovorax sp. N23]MCU4121173.1 hypothetical protein [Variovorax sp. N23]
MNTRIRSFVVPVVGVLFTVIYLLDVEYVSSMRGLDLSWHVMLGYAYENKLQHGTQIIFNYGPLSFIESAVYFERTHSEKMAYRATYLLILGLGVFTVFQIRSPLRLLAWCGLTVLLLLLRDVYLLLPALLLCHQECRRQPGNITQLALSVLLAFGAAFACLVKSNAVFFSVPAIVLASLYRFSIRDYRPVVPFCFVLSVFLLFWLSGQEVSNFFEFLDGYIDVSRAYNEDMGLPAPLVLHIAFFIGAAIVATTLRFHNRLSMVLGVLTLGYLLVAYKMGFIRHGEHPEAAFLALAFISTVQLWSPGGNFRDGNHRRLVAAVAFAAASFVASSALLASLLPHGDAFKGYASVLQHRIRYVLDSKFRGGSSVEAQRRYNVALTQARAAIPFDATEAPIDIFPFEFSLAYASEMPIATRPAFQSYFATSRHMTERNERFLYSRQAPRSVIFGVSPIDGRYAALEDPLALGAYRRLYQVERHSSDAILLKRRAAPLAQSQICRNSQLRFNQLLAIPSVDPDQAVWSEVTVVQSWLGQLLSMLIGHPVVHMTVATSESSRDYRYLREAGQVGFLLSPALASTEAATHFFNGTSRPEDGVRSFSIHQPSGPLPWFDETISVKLCVLSWGAGE